MRPKASSRVLLASVVCALLCAGHVDVALAQHASAEVDAPSVPTAGDKKRVAVGKFQGAKPDSARKWVVEGLGADASLEVHTNLVDVSSKSKESEIAAVGRELGADVVLVGKTKLAGKWTATIAVHDGRTGAVVEEVEVKGASFEAFEAELREAAELRGSIAKAVGWPRPEPEPEPEPVAVEPEEAPPPAPVEESKGRPSPLFGHVGFGIQARSFRYTGTLPQTTLESYTQEVAPAPQVEVLWFPAAHFTDAWPAHLGISGGFSTVLAVSPTARVTSPDGAQTQDVQLSQSQLRWYAGLEGRIPLDPVRILVDARFGQQSFSLDGDDVTLGNDGALTPGGAPRLPDVNYQTIAVGADVEWRPERLILGAYGRYLVTLSSGDVSSAAWFPETSVVGVEVGGRVGWQLSRVFDVLVGIDSQLYGLDFNPVPPTTPPERVAGGATDRYLTVWLGLGFRIPEDRPAQAASDSSAPAATDFDSFD